MINFLTARSERETSFLLITFFGIMNKISKQASKVYNIMTIGAESNVTQECETKNKDVLHPIMSSMPIRQAYDTYPLFAYMNFRVA